MDPQYHVTFLPLWNVDSEMLQYLIVWIENGSLGKEKGEISPLLPPLLRHWIGVIPRETSLYKIIFELVNIYPMLKDFKDSLKPPYPQHRTLTANSEQTSLTVHESIRTISLAMRLCFFYIIQDECECV